MATARRARPGSPVLRAGEGACWIAAPAMPTRTPALTSRAPLDGDGGASQGTPRTFFTARRSSRTGTAAPRAPCARYSCLPVPGAPVPRRSGYPSAVVRPRPGRRRSRPPARPGRRRSFAPEGASHFFVRHALLLSRAGAPGGVFRSRGRDSPPLLRRSIVGRPASCPRPRALPPSCRLIPV